MVVGVLGARWYSGLSLLSPFGSSESVPVSLGHTLYADTGLTGASTTASWISIQVTTITPHVDSNTSNATIHLMGLLQVRLTSLTRDEVSREGCCYAEEVPPRVQAGCGQGRSSR